MAEVLCASVDLADGESLRVSFRHDDHAHGICLIRKQGRVHGYLNRCPHMAMAMDWMPGRFLDESGDYVVCAMHGARFQVEDGLCVEGPCLGRSLTAVALQERDGQILLLDSLES